MSCPVFRWVRTVTHRVLPMEDRMSVWDRKREWKLYSSFVRRGRRSPNHSDDSLNCSTQVWEALKSAGWCREPGEIWDQKWVFWPILEQQEPTESRSQVFFCVNETLITTNTHRDSQRCSRKTTSAHLTISESQNQWNVFACSSQSVSVLHYNLQSTRGRRRAALQWGATVDSVTGRNRKGRRLASVCVFLCMCCLWWLCEPTTLRQMFESQKRFS